MIMKKILRLSLIAILSLICGTGFAQTTFDFDNDYATLFPSLPGTSSNDSHDGDFTEATTCSIDGISITVSAKQAAITRIVFGHQAHVFVCIQEH